jgi:hypothetical protein
VHIKLKSTTNKDGPDTSNAVDGLVYDGYGYSCTLDHFLSLLRNPKLQTFVREVREIVACPTEEELSRVTRRALRGSRVARAEEEEADTAEAPATKRPREDGGGGGEVEEADGDDEDDGVQV